MYLKDKLPDQTSDAKVDPFTLPALITWLRTKPGQETYCWARAGECLFAQYGEFISELRGTAAYQYAVGGFSNATACELAIAARLPRNFAAALARAEALLP